MSHSLPSPGVVLRALLIVAVAAGCGGSDVGGLDGRTFLSTTVTQAGAPRPLVEGTRIQLDFQEGGQLGASAGCNRIGGTYRVEGGLLQFDGVAMTEMGCDGRLQAQDAWLVAFLGSGPSVALADAGLVLAAGDTVVQLLDREVAEPDLPLVGPAWRVDTVVDGDTAMGLAGGVAATIQFGADGSVRFNTGCNEGSAMVTVDGPHLRFVEVVTTRRACEGPAAELETGVLAVLGADARAGVTYDITADRLTLTSGDRGLGLVGG